MKYEFIMKIKECPQDQWHIKYRVVVKPERFQSVKYAYESAANLKKAEWFDYVILINKLDDEGNFIEVIQ